MLTNRLPRSLGWCVGALGLGAWLSACGDAETDSAGSAGYGAVSGWTFVPIGNGATSSTGGTPGSSGNGQGGTAGKGGAGGGGGTGGMVGNPVTFKCGHKVPSQPIITSFDGYVADRWVSPGNLDGGGYAYPDSVKLAMADYLGTEAQIEDYSGIGAWFGGCIDAAKFKGVTFKVSGSVGATSTVQFFLITNSTKDVNEADGVGECVPSDPSDAWGSCRPPVVSLPVGEEPQTVFVPWTSFKGGLPNDKTDGSDIIALQWSFEWIDENESQPYAAKLTVDDLAFYSEEPTGNGGAGGQGPTGEAGAAALPIGGAGI